MTREEAINELTDLLPEEYLMDYAEAIEMGIEALKQDQCGDCISRQEVLDALDKSKYSNEFCEERHIDWSINLGMAHIVVNELKSVAPQPCGDCISREAVLKAIDAKAWEFCDYLISNGRNDEQKPVSHFADNLRECVGEDLPPVTPAPKMGHWIKCIDDNGSSYYLCSACRCGEDYNFDFCPNCGSKNSE